ncbi:O-antigen ligase family protein [Martelella alba]|nr:O-antigen ligase family protein [Martelella alba]
MTSTDIKDIPERYCAYFFMAFLFFSAIFCGYTHVNNLFHLALILLIAALLLNGRNLARRFIADKAFKDGFLLIACFLVYYSLSNLWSHDHGNVLSALRHSSYLLAFLFIYRQACLHRQKHRMLTLAMLGLLILALLIFFFVDKESLLTNRLENSFFAAPSNVIDVAGYFGIGIFLCLILVRDTGKKGYYLPIPVFLIGILLTQSRGPLLSLVVALMPLLFLKPAIRRHHILIFTGFLVFLIAFIFLSNFESILFNRFENAYQQSFIRFGIWLHTLDLVSIHPFFGWGFDKELHFTSSIQEQITTTHSLYLSALLKGGLVGFLLLFAVLMYGVVMAWRQCLQRQYYEAALFLFMLFFYITQGMFVIGNPGVPWYLFWFPLAVVLSLPADKPAEQA